MAVLATVVAALAVGCSSDGGSDSSSAAVTLTPPSTAASDAATLPAEVDPGTAALAVGPRLVRFVLKGCSLKPIIDPDGVALVIDISGDDGQGGALEVSRKTTAGGGKSLPTTTDTVSYTAAGASELIAQRFAVGGTVRDPIDPTATLPLLTVDGVSVRASGLFSSLDAAAGSAALVYGYLLVTCTPDALVR